MKLCDIREMAIPAGDHPEYPDDQVEAAIKWIKDGGKPLPIEGGKFSLLKKEDTIALQRARDGEVLGWVIVGDLTEIGGKKLYPIGNIQILPRYRKTVAAMMLINGVRNVLDHPVIIDGIIFKDGQQLINAIAQRPQTMPNVYTINLHTGKMRPYDPSDMTIDASTGFVLEKFADGNVYKSKLPHGEEMSIVLEMFCGLTSGME